jgi:endonuclease-3 related protein
MSKDEHLVRDSAMSSIPGILAIILLISFINSLSMDRILNLYSILYRKYGPQHWWPGETQYEMIIGAVLTQNTAWSNVEKAITNLKLANSLDPNTIIEMNEDRLKQLIRPSGFYNQKAERLKLITEWYLDNRNKAKSMDRMALRQDLLGIKGIGKETSDSIVLYGFEKPIFVVDAYTRRFCSHYDLLKEGEYDDYRLLFEDAISLKTKVFNEYHALIVAWGKNNR